MEWVRWIVTVIAIAAAYYAGDRAGNDRATIASQATDLQRANKAIDAKDNEMREAVTRAQADVLSRDELADALARIEGRFGGIGRQLAGALENANLAVCVYPDAVRSVRADARGEAAAAAERARAAAADRHPPG